ncbi:caspase family protein [Rhizobium panacihumi]|uniref:caspase family protein n=1 Tax=Rhizobium panacihumi TaxID=2008450 RepID=UPI003D78CFFC
MTKRTLTVLCVHGLGNQAASGWKEAWPTAIRDAFPVTDEIDLAFQFVSYDDIFAETDRTALDYVVAIGKLLKSGAGAIGGRRGILTGLSERLRWTAGYVVAWVEDVKFQAATRERVLTAVKMTKPDIIVAHSLGSLITYNAFSHADARQEQIAEVLQKAHYVTLGSQIGNPFVVGNLTNGRIVPLNVAFWHHLFNIHDDVFTAPIRLWAMSNFRQTDTPFDDPGMTDHAATSYFKNPATIENVWRTIAKASLPQPGRKTAVRDLTAPRAQKAPGTTRKALLVGINDYPTASQKLEGCVNDVFTMSAVLQQCGMPADAIRVCLDDRATADGIMTRLKWLLDDPKPGDELIFYYSGHGARVPEYGENTEPDHHVETLVPWDFDWTPEKYISDDQIFDLYSQLPYDCRLIMIFDCCHAGGIHRDSGARPRGISPPDDIRHRELKWDSRTEMWVARDFARINDKFTRDKHAAVDYYGNNGATERLGRAGMLRRLSDSQYERLKKTDAELARGPYLPVIIEACREEEFSYEYRHGATSHGAFTFSLANILRRSSNRDEKLTLRDLVKHTHDQLADLGYDQKPTILGPNFRLDQEIPWTNAFSPGARAR